MTRSGSKNVSDECAMAYCHAPPYETSRWCRKHRDYYGQDSGTRPDEVAATSDESGTNPASGGDSTHSAAASSSGPDVLRKASVREVGPTGNEGRSSGPDSSAASNDESVHEAALDALGIDREEYQRGVDELVAKNAAAAWRSL